MSRVVGGANTLSKMRSRFPGSYPVSLVQGRGARVEDSAGRDYIDWICSLGALSLGYLNYMVDRAVGAQVRKGPIFSLPDVELEERVAGQLCELVPCAEAVRFVKTGSECTEAAIRVARAYTGREVVLQCGYHSWHSWYAATREHSPGVPLAMKGLVKTFKYNDIIDFTQTVHAAEAVQGGVAAIIIEPTLFEEPAPGFLEAIRMVATGIGAVLIFDETVTGFRWHAGGYQALCGVTPDLATFGKGMGNGYPIAALVGRADIMRHAMLVSGTFGGDCIGLAAAKATMQVYQQAVSPDHPKVSIRHGEHVMVPARIQNFNQESGTFDFIREHLEAAADTRLVQHDVVTSHMWVIGSRLMDGYNALADKFGAPTRMEGQPPHPRIVWDEPETVWDRGQDGELQPYIRKNRHRASLFFQECAKRGVLFHPDGINVMLAHGQAELDQTLDACRTAMAAVVHAIKRGTVRQEIQGEPISPEPPWRVTA